MIKFCMTHNFDKNAKETQHAPLRNTTLPQKGGFCVPMTQRAMLAGAKAPDWAPCQTGQTVGVRRSVFPGPPGTGWGWS